MFAVTVQLVQLNSSSLKLSAHPGSPWRVSSSEHLSTFQVNFTSHVYTFFLSLALWDTRSRVPRSLPPGSMSPSAPCPAPLATAGTAQAGRLTQAHSLKK